MDIPEELAQSYLLRRLSDLEALEKALLVEDYETCERIGHRLKGSASTFGFEDLAELARHLEKDANQEDVTSLFDDVNKFKIWLYKYIH